MTQHEIDGLRAECASLRAENERLTAKTAALIARWREDAKAMDEMAEDDGDNTDEAMECRERSRTLRDCANDLAKPCVLPPCCPHGNRPTGNWCGCPPDAKWEAWLTCCGQAFVADSPEDALAAFDKWAGGEDTKP